MKKFSNIIESVWSDIHKRSNGDKVRKEDDVNILDIKDLCYYLKTIYKSSNNSIHDNIYIQDYYLTICLYQDEDGYFRFLYYDGSSIETQYDVLETINCISEIKQKYTINTYTNDFDVKIATIYPKDQARVPVTNRFFIEIIDFLLDRINVPLEQQIEKITESVWSDIHKRSNGVTTRKEDDLTNIRDLVPVDMGVTVLWADRDLEWKDGGCYFNYNEANNIIKNSKWRIPTKQESYELFQYTTMIKNTNEVCIQEGKFDDKPQLIFDKKGFQYGNGNNDKIFHKSMYAMWTSTEKEIEIYYMSVIGRMNDNHYTSMHYGNRLCVRLVKDR